MRKAFQEVAEAGLTEVIGAGDKRRLQGAVRPQLFTSAISATDMDRMKRWRSLLDGSWKRRPTDPGCAIREGMGGWRDRSPSMLVAIGVNLGRSAVNADGGTDQIRSLCLKLKGFLMGLKKRGRGYGARRRPCGTQAGRLECSRQWLK